MNRPVGEGLSERIVDEAVLVDEREALEARARDRDVKVVAVPGPVDDGELGRVRERAAEELLEAPAHADDDSNADPRRSVSRRRA